MKNYKKFLYQYALFIGLFSLPLLVSFVTIVRSYENMPFKNIVFWQQKLHAIYGSALNGNSFIYKGELFKSRKPALMALGSSRMLEMREQFFTRSFANCGLAMSHLNEGIMFLEDMFKFHKPEVILLGLDFWWFNGSYLQPRTFPEHQMAGNGHVAFKILQPYVWLRNKKLSLKQLVDVTFFNDTKNHITNYENMGVAAIRFSRGFRPDGSFLNAEIWFSQKKFGDAKFQKTLTSIKNGRDFFEHGNSIPPARLKQFQRLMKICRENNVKLVVVLLPLPPAVYARMQEKAGDYAYIKELRDFLRTLPVETYDFFDAPAEGFNDCEFYDGIHPGDVISQRMLLKIVEQNPDTILKKYLNIPLMSAKIEEFSGHVCTIYNKSMYNFPETDFLHLGCKK